MRRLNLNAMLFLTLLGLAVYACNDDSSSSDRGEAEFTEEDMADIVAASISADDGGYASELEDLLSYVEEACGTNKNESGSKSQDTTDRDYEIAYEMHFEIYCEEGAFQQMTYTYTSTREADLVRISASNETNSEWVWSEGFGGVYVLDGTYQYSGAEEMKVRDLGKYSSEITYESDNLTITHDGNFESGALTVHMVFTANDESREIDGTLSIDTENMALLDVATWDYLYEIDMITGDVTARIRYW